MILHRNSVSLIAATILLCFPNYFLMPTKVAFAQTQNVQDRKAQGDKLNQEGLQLLNKGQLKAALEKFQQALAIRKEVGDRAGEGRTLNNIGGVYASLVQRYGVNNITAKSLTDFTHKPQPELAVNWVMVKKFWG
jgi:tetratricopeptide (TPR) repeat protein